MSIKYKLYQLKEQKPVNETVIGMPVPPTSVLLAPSNWLHASANAVPLPSQTSWL